MRLVNSILLLLVTTIAFGQKVKDYTISKDVFEHYQELNNKEQRLIHFKDSDEILLIKLKQLAHLNKARKKHKRTPVKLDIFASRVANKICQQGVDGAFMGHYNLQGESPYLRYSRAGGMHHVQENAASITGDRTLPNSDNDLLLYMQKANDAFMAERKPNDGHKQNCINKYHTSVGLGLAIKKKEFRYYEEFLDEYLVFGEINKKAKVNQEVSLPIKPIDSKHIHMALIYHEQFPKPMTAKQIMRIHSYNDFTDELSHRFLPWHLPQADKKGFYYLKMTFDTPGLYYVHVYLGDKPYVSEKISTEGKVQASGIVVEVN